MLHVSAVARKRTAGLVKGAATAAAPAAAASGAWQPVTHPETGQTYYYVRTTPLTCPRPSPARPSHPSFPLGYRYFRCRTHRQARPRGPRRNKHTPLSRRSDAPSRSLRGTDRDGRWAGGVRRIVGVAVRERRCLKAFSAGAHLNPAASPPLLHRPLLLPLSGPSRRPARCMSE